MTLTIDDVQHPRVLAMVRLLLRHQDTIEVATTGCVDLNEIELHYNQSQVQGFLRVKLGVEKVERQPEGCR